MAAAAAQRRWRLAAAAVASAPATAPFFCICVGWERGKSSSSGNGSGAGNSAIVCSNMIRRGGICHGTSNHGRGGVNIFNDMDEPCWVFILLCDGRGASEEQNFDLAKLIFIRVRYVHADPINFIS